jgi:hypothetical protein
MIGRRHTGRLVLALVLSLSAAPAAAQHYVGVRGGIGGGTARFDPKQEAGFDIGYPSAGLVWKYYSPTRVAGGIELDLQYVGKAYKMFTYIEDEAASAASQIPVYSDTVTYTRSIRAIEMPFMWQPHFYLMNRRARVFLNLGMYASYYLSEHERQESNHNSAEAFDRPYEIRSVRDNRIDFGLVGGVGFGVFFGRFEVLAEARYGFGYSDLMKPNSKYPLNRYNRTPIDRVDVSVGLNYRLGRGGILAPPLK